MMVPFTAQAKALDVSVTSTASTSIALPAVGSAIRIVNEGPNICFVSIGVAAQTAVLPHSSVPTNTSTPVPPGDYCLSIPPTDTALNFSAICRSGQTARLTVQVGEGI